jgi:pimeloyl-ACP methyl ester carboxylesterase
MIKLALPSGVEYQHLQTTRGPLPALRGLPSPKADRGIDVIMASGFFGTKEDFRELLSLLALAGFRGWAYDYRGQLDPDVPGPYLVSQLADDMLAVVRAAAAGRPAHLIGHCLGGFVARSAALREPAVARSLTLLACGPSLRERKHEAMLGGLAAMHAHGGAMALWPLVKRLLAEDDTIMREFWRAKLAAMNSRWVTGVAESMADEPDRTAELAATGLPALVIHGKRDRRPWSPDVYAQMADRLGAGRVVVERASHSPNMEQPGPTAAALLDFWPAVLTVVPG